MPSSAPPQLRLPLLAFFLALLLVDHCADAAELSRIETIVIIYPENRSFDHLYGLFPGVNGIANATKEQMTQRDHDGSVLPYLRVWDIHGKADPRFPQLPNAPFRVDAEPVGLSADLVLLSPMGECQSPANV